MPASVHDVLDQDEWRLEEIRIILERDPSSIYEERYPKTAAYCRDGLVTPLHRVLMDKRCSADIVQLLLHYGADPNRHVFVSRWGGTVSPISIVIRTCCLPHRSVGINMIGVISALVEGGAKIDQTEDWSLNIALNMNADPEVIRLLVKAGADLLRADRPELPLFNALKHFDIRTFGSLLDLLDVDINNIRNKNDGSLLDSALSIPGCTAEFVGFLIDRGISVDSVNRFGSTPLHYALGTWYPTHIDVVDVLLKMGSLVSTKNQSGETSLEIALKYHYDIKVRKLLLKYILIENPNFDLDDWVPLYRPMHSIDKILPIPDHESKNIKSYGNDCKRELRRMSSEIVGNWRTLLDFLQNYSGSQMRKNGENGFNFDPLLKLISKKKYPLYLNVIVSKLGHSLLKPKLEDCHVRTVVRIRTGVKYVKREVSLNFNCACVVANYLEETDLLNMIMAFHK